MKRCLGMSSSSSAPADAPAIASSSEGFHVDSRELRDSVTQLEVHVYGGFVEVETIAEYSGYTDHSGQPLLWSHDVEFVVDISGIFCTLEKGLYTVKVVRFHRTNVFAKWRLARRNPIIKAMQ
uniref:Uncharacterized protein n=2 Tax=Caenorhabditis japonica TaxID=281687 RepID=A0A8R1E2U3_CAEJA